MSPHQGKREGMEPCGAAGCVCVREREGLQQQSPINDNCYLKCRLWPFFYEIDAILFFIPSSIFKLNKGIRMEKGL